MSDKNDMIYPKDDELKVKYIDPEEPLHEGIQNRKWIDRDNEKLNSEYGTVGNVRFLKPSNLGMYDVEGNLILCKCGKPAGAGIIGKEAYLAFCPDCSPLPDSSENFVYRPPKGESE